jgi:hypothetical protein
MSDLDSVGEKSSNQRLMGVAFMNLGEVKLRPILMDFLKENGAYEAFVRNWKSGDIIIPLSELNSLRGSDCIDSAFVWDDTPEKFEYWFNLSLKFREVDI